MRGSGVKYWRETDGGVSTAEAYIISKCIISAREACSETTDFSGY
jgi:hypothetical protein